MSNDKLKKDDGNVKGYTIEEDRYNWSNCDWKDYDENVTKALVAARNGKASQNDTTMKILTDGRTDILIRKVIGDIKSLYCIDNSVENEFGMLYACGKDVVIKVVTDFLQGAANAFKPKIRKEENGFIAYIWQRIEYGILDYCNSSDLPSIDLPMDVIREVEEREKEWIKENRKKEISKSELQSIIYCFIIHNENIKEGIKDMIAYWNTDRYQFEQTDNFLGADKWIVGTVREVINNVEKKQLPAQIENTDKDYLALISDAVMNRLTYNILEEYENYKSNKLIKKVRRKVRELECESKQKKALPEIQEERTNDNGETLSEIRQRYELAMTKMRFSDEEKKDVHDFLNKKYGTISLDKTLGDGANGKTLEELLPDKKNAQEYNEVSNDDLKEIFEERTRHIVFASETYTNAFEAWKKIVLLKMEQEGDVLLDLSQNFSLSEKKEVLCEIYGSEVEDDMTEDEIHEEYEILTKQFEDEMENT